MEMFNIRISKKYAKNKKIFCRNIYCIIFNKTQSKHYGINQWVSIEDIAVDHVFEISFSNNNSP